MPRPSQRSIIVDIGNERMKQHRHKRDGRFLHVPEDPELSNSERLAMLVEEVGEVARCTLAREDLVRNEATIHSSAAALYSELCQVAAITTAWMEFIQPMVPPAA